MRVDFFFSHSHQDLLSHFKSLSWFKRTATLLISLIDCQDGNIFFFRLISPPPSIIFCNTTRQWIVKQKPNTECLLLILFISPMTHFNLITVIGHCYRPFIVNSFKENDDPAYRWFVHEKNGPQLTCLRRTILFVIWNNQPIPSVQNDEPVFLTELCFP